MPLALDYRPRTWSDLVGQETVTKIIMGMIKANALHPFLIFGGSRGLGKTSSARILAKAINCPNQYDANPCNACDLCHAIDEDRCPDVIELDAASNGGVASIRRIRDIALYAPVMASKRIILLDEAHAMSREAFQAMLKILEEPPPNTIFIMATTEAVALPETIISRSFPFEFRRISALDIQRRLASIAEKESLSVTSDALHAIAVHVSGGMRDAITLMEQATHLGPNVTADIVTSMLGLLVRSEVSQLLDYLREGRRAKVFLWIRDVNKRGIDPSFTVTAILAYLRDLMAASVGFRGDMTEQDFNRSQAQAMQMGMSRLAVMADRLMDLSSKMTRSVVPGDILLDLTLSALTLRDEPIGS